MACFVFCVFIQALREACERMTGLSATCHQKRFRAVSENLAFEPSEWKDGGWSAKTVSNARVSWIRNIPYSTYYKPMGDLSYISSEEGGGLIIHH